MFIIPFVKFSSQNHPAVRLCQHLRLWSKPILDDAEMTASAIGGVLWLVIALATVVISGNFVVSAALLGIFDHVARYFGIKSHYFWIPLWVYAFVFCFLFWSVPKISD